MLTEEELREAELQEQIRKLEILLDDCQQENRILEWERDDAREALDYD